MREILKRPTASVKTQIRNIIQGFIYRGALHHAIFINCKEKELLLLWVFFSINTEICKCIIYVFTVIISVTLIREIYI